jgi:hypothetical protein
LGSFFLGKSDALILTKNGMGHILGDFWRFLAILGDFGRILTIFGDFGDFWRFLAIFGDFWRFLAIFSQTHTATLTSNLTDLTPGH